MSKWKMVRLGDVATYINGFAFKPSDWCETGLPIIRIQNLTNSSKEINYYDKSYNPKYEVNNGDILISWSASLGVYEWKKGKALLNQHIFKVVFDKLDIDKKFFVYSIQTLLAQMAEETHGATMKHITKPKFDNMPFPLPPLEEQKRIADILDKASNLMDLRKQQLEKMDLLIKSKFINMFGDPVTNPKGWDKLSYDEICSKITDGEHITPIRDSHGIYLLSARNILNHKLQLEDVDFISEKEYFRISKRIIPEENDILISCSGSVGRVCRVPKNFKAQLVRSVAILKLSKIINPIFMEYLIDSDYTQRQISQGVNQSSQANLFQGTIKKMISIIPPLEMQNKFAEFVEQVEKQKAVMQQSLEKIETNYKALMQEYFG